MNNKTYLIRLTPLDTYFFGSENTFNEGASQNYYVESNLLPQVSTLLGALRYEVLRQHSLLSYNKQDKTVLRRVEQLIGRKGFCMDQKVESYGIIQSISPLFIEDSQQKTFYTPLPLDYAIDVSPDASFSCSLSSGHTVQGMQAPSFDYKHYRHGSYWINNKLEKIGKTELFIPKEQVGITKNNKADDESDAYYKVINYTLKPGFKFIFAAEISPSDETDHEYLEEGVSFVYMGGNRSMFKMEIEEVKDKSLSSADTYFTKIFSCLHKAGRQLLLGDAFLTDTERDDIPFYWAMSKDNRYIITQHDAERHWGKPRKTNILYHLMSRGGVVYTDNDKPVPAPAYLTCVGLNIFI